MPDNSFIKRLRISKIVTETKDSKTFILEPLDNWKPFYQPGQFITLVFNTGEHEKRRSYSFSSCPDLNEPPAITVKKIDNGEFSRMLIYQAKENDILYSSGVGGQFVLEKDDITDHYLFFAAGSGITPCYSMIKSLLATTTKTIFLIYSNRSEAEAIFYNELKVLQDEHGERFHINFLFSNIRNVYKSRLSHWLLQQILAEFRIADWKRVKSYLCGPFDYMKMIEITLLTRQPAANILKENFNTLPRLIVARPPDTSMHHVKVQFRNNEYKLDVQFPKSILATAKANNVQLPYSCEAGRCSSCVATCTKGKVWMAYNEVLTEDETERGRILVCQAYPVYGDVEIEYP